MPDNNISKLKMMTTTNKKGIRGTREREKIYDLGLLSLSRYPFTEKKVIEAGKEKRKTHRDFGI